MLCASARAGNHHRMSASTASGAFRQSRDRNHPFVFVVGFDPIGAGLVASLSTLGRDGC